MADAIKRQIEFYYSDSNFRKDTFLREAAATDPEGFVPIATLLTFNKLKSMTTDASVVAEAIAGSDSVVLSEDKLKIRRSEPLPEGDNSKENTLYVKGYPESDESVTIDAITEQFSAYGKVCMVRLRKDGLTRAFKGSCFVEYDSPAAVAAAVAAAHDDEKKVTLCYKETPFLCVMPLTEWLERKAAKGKKSGGGIADAAPGSKRKRDGDDSGDEGEAKEISFTPGLIIRLTGVPTDCSLFALKDAVKAYGELRYVEYAAGTDVAFARMGDEAGATAAMKALAAGEVKVGEEGAQTTLAGVLLAGEEEHAYWQKIGQGSSARAGKGGRGGRGGGRGRGGRGRGRGGKRGRR
jgi:lupus La protein